jgi:hypothetical protein
MLRIINSKKLINISALFFIFCGINILLSSQSIAADFMEDVQGMFSSQEKTETTKEKNTSPAKNLTRPSTDATTCSVCKGKGYIEVGGQQMTCPRCGGVSKEPANNSKTESASSNATVFSRNKTANHNENKDADTAEKGTKIEYHEIGGELIPVTVKNTGTKNTVQTKEEKNLPWDPAHSPSKPLQFIHTKDESNNRNNKEVEDIKNYMPLKISSPKVVSAESIEFSTLWGRMPFARRGSYQYRTYRGPGFSIKIPTSWQEKVLPHKILGGTQHRYISDDGLTYLVVVTFSLENGSNLENYLAKKQVKLLSAFKNISMYNVVLGRKKGLGGLYQGILMMQDVNCHLFFTQHKGKGYMVYGLYFDHDGGISISSVLASLRIF